MKAAIIAVENAGEAYSLSVSRLDPANAVHRLLVFVTQAAASGKVKVSRPLRAIDEAIETRILEDLLKRGFKVEVEQRGGYRWLTISWGEV